MVETSVLLSLLQFVALAAPAIAILMQVIQERQGADFAFHLLISSLLLIVFGGLIICYLLYTTISNPLLSGGIVLIFGSFVTLAGALTFTTLITAKKSSPGTGSLNISQLPRYIGRTIGVIAPGLTALLILTTTFGVALILIRNLVNQTLDYGMFNDGSGFEPYWFFTAITALFILQTIIKLVENQKMKQENFGDSAQAALVISLTWLAGYALFVGPPFVLGYGFVNYGGEYFQLSRENVLLNLPYIWAGFVAVILFAVDVDLE